MNSLKICTINIDGMNSCRKQDSILDFSRRYNVDILCIQETFIDTYFKSKKFENNYRCIWRYGSNCSSRVVVIFLNDNLNIKHLHVDFTGRMIYVDFTLDDEIVYRLVNVYSPVSPGERSDFFNDISRYLVTSNHLILVGDFNFIHNSSVDKIGGSYSREHVGSNEFKYIQEQLSW